MKSITSIIMALLMLTSLDAFSQAVTPPQLINFNGRALNGNAPITNPISVRIKILGVVGQTKYHEVHSNIIPDVNGYYNLKIGAGSVIYGPLINIDWGWETHDLQVSIDPNNGSNYTITNTTPMLTVPYAFHAETSGSGTIFGTPGKLLKFMDDKVAGNSNVSDNGTCVSIGTSSPGFNNDFFVNAKQIGGSYFTNSVVSTDTRAIKAELMIQNVDAVAIEGTCANSDYYGIGGVFSGGYIGLVGKVSLLNANQSYIGIQGLVSSTSGNKSGKGVYANCIGPGTNYGLYATASGGSTNYAGYFNGNVTVTGTFSNVSDIKFKNDIQPVSNALSTIMQLQPKAYSFKTSEYKSMNLPEGKHYGFIAQDMERIMPELVTNNIHSAEYNDKKEKISKEIHFKAINYIELISVMVGSIQDQQKIIEKMQLEIDQLKNIKK